MDPTLYRRPLPAEAVAFSSAEGRQLFAETLAAGGLDGYFPLAEQFHTQSEPAYCGLGSLVVALNALAIDPGRLWKGPWRWFGEELLDCCVPLEEVRARGLSMGELACLARCNGAAVDVVHANETNLAAWREALVTASRGDAVLIAAYDRAALGQTGGGHFSPIGGFNEVRNLTLVLDVARFKYPPHWVDAERLWRAMHPIDPATSLSRGWLLLRPRVNGVALGFSVTCHGESWQGLARRLRSTIHALGEATNLAALASALVPLTAQVGVRLPTAAAHLEALATARAALRELPLHAEVLAAVGAEHAEAVSVLLLATADRLLPAQRAHVAELSGEWSPDSPLTTEVANVRAQIAALWQLAREAD